MAVSMSSSRKGLSKHLHAVFLLCCLCSRSSLFLFANWFLSHAVFHLGLLSLLLPCQTCKESKADGGIHHPSACAPLRIAPIGREGVCPRFWGQLRKQDHRNISYQGQEIWTRGNRPGSASLLLG